ncbi:MAG: beta-glucosidase, partial [Thermoproteota archaeon]
MAVIGQNADSKRNLHGDYSFTAHMDMANPPPGYEQVFREGAVRTVSILEGIRNRAPGNMLINYAKGCDITGESREGFGEAVKVVLESDVVIAVRGEKS